MAATAPTPAAAGYRRHRPETTALYELVRDNLQTLYLRLPVFASGAVIARWEGALFLFYYVAYTAYVVMTAQQHDALPAFGGVMVAYVLPLTAITLVVVGWRAWRAGRG